MVAAAAVPGEASARGVEPFGLQAAMAKRVAAKAALKLTVYVGIR